MPSQSETDEDVFFFQKSLALLINIFNPDLWTPSGSSSIDCRPGLVGRFVVQTSPHWIELPLPKRLVSAF